MANENETVEQVCEAATTRVRQSYSWGVRQTALQLIERGFAAHKRELAAHKREIADFQRRYDECVRKFNEADLERVRLRDEVAAKDAEIAELREHLREAVKWSCGNPNEACEDCVAHGGDTPCKCEKWRKALERGAEDSANNLRALIGALVEGVQYPPLCKDCDDSCEIRSECKILKFRSLVEKAKEVLNG